MGERKKPMNLAMSERTRSKIEALKERLDSDSLSEVIRRSVELLEILSDRQSNGDTIVLRTPEGKETEVIILR
ncbi:hypothetical protein TRP8649_01411 [Pelagimonas phthalicica]|uniref:Ribbon-helix-helix protein CopG domain-containing protein n=1 Tax=Pelagimonas phthalicica TaxID=1037362 RepID=A0A238J9H4_9RHOB|nr:ribbon-helix-helix protein, CopG family [Pelagimonas phthalicica]TDS94167.1 hypothetical protein CLV87_0661 [Pelagimonas phthalicica]SMX27308.1 hypothetical protein TRP8649_01411 [Pelagimonas phthalicica]